MSDFVRVSQLSGEALDAPQDGRPQGADAAFQREGGSQGFYPRLQVVNKRLVVLSGRVVLPVFTGLVEWQDGYAFVCLTHGLLTHAVGDVLDVKQGCPGCEADAELAASRGRRLFMEAVHG